MKCTVPHDCGNQLCSDIHMVLFLQMLGPQGSMVPGMVPGNPPQPPPEKKKPHVKKPLNAFMLFMREKRADVMKECSLKESAAINQILGKMVRVWSGSKQLLKGRECKGQCYETDSIWLCVEYCAVIGSVESQIVLPVRGFRRDKLCICRAWPGSCPLLVHPIVCPPLSNTRTHTHTHTHTHAPALSLPSM